MVKNNLEYPILIAQSGPLDGQRWKIKSKLLLGRNPDCDVVIPMRQVSRHHLEIYQSDEGTMAKDLDSKNGTFINGHRINEIVPLEEGDEIQVSLAQHFIYLSSDATMPLDALPIEMQKRRLQFDLGARRVWILEEELDPSLSASQYNLLKILYEQSGEVVERSEIIQAVWGKSAQGVTEQALDALVRRLRDRLAELDPSWEYIVTVRGHGLRLENPPTSQAS